LENLYSFVNTWLLSQEGNLEIVLRIDDMDQGRLRMEYLDDIFRSLESLGVDYQIGPSGPSDFIEN
jgi:glutamyl-tRNA synthetase